MDIHKMKCPTWLITIHLKLPKRPTNISGKHLGKYSFRNAEGNWPISTDIGIMQEYYCHTLLNCRYYIYYSSLCTAVQDFGNCRATWVKIPETFYELLIFSCEFSKMKIPLAEIVKYDQC